MTRYLKDLKPSEIRCDICKESGDDIYFNQVSNEVLYIVCKVCKKDAEMTLRYMANKATHTSDEVH